MKRKKDKERKKERDEKRKSVKQREGRKIKQLTNLQMKREVGTYKKVEKVGKKQEQIGILK